MAALANWDIAMIAWGTVWILGGAGLIYGLIRAIAAEDREIQEFEREEALHAAITAEKVANERPMVGAA